MFTKTKQVLLRRLLGGFCTAGIMFQFAGCDLTQITTSVTVDGRQLISGAIRNAILTPIDVAITQAVNDLLSVD